MPKLQESCSTSAEVACVNTIGNVGMREENMS